MTDSPEQHSDEQHPRFPVTPYAGASGGGSDSSGDSDATTRYLDDANVTSAVQRGVYLRVRAAGAEGATVAEIRENSTLGHHGRVSSALSTLHLRGHLAMLHESRNRCRVYVLPQYVSGRETVEHGSNKPKAPLPEGMASVTDLAAFTSMLDRAGIAHAEQESLLGTTVQVGGARGFALVFRDDGLADVA